MTVFGIIIGIALMGGMGYLALDKKSTFHVRLASLGALAVMILTSIICLFLVFTVHPVTIDESVLIVGAPAEVKEDDTNYTALIFLIVFFVLLFITIAVLSLREHKRK